jgi:hypothetical protein
MQLIPILHAYDFLFCHGQFRKMNKGDNLTVWITTKLFCISCGQASLENKGKMK